MTNDNGILIKNIYHMLAYALPALVSNGYAKVQSEHFDNIHDLMAAILIIGVSRQYKRGLHKDYITVSENLSTLRGQLNIVETIRNKILSRHKLACNFDDFSENNPGNQVIKTALSILSKSKHVSTPRRHEIKKLLQPLWHIDTICPTSINWGGLLCRHHNKNSEYTMLLTLSRFVITSQLQTTVAGENKTISIQDFTHKELAAIYENFVLAYYKRHFPELNPHAPRIAWDMTESTAPEYLHDMHTDIVLSNGQSTLIIDTKFYSKPLTQHYNKTILPPGNVYQIFTYVMNMAATTPNVSGMLLYAKTEDNAPPAQAHTICNHKIEIATLDLNQDFETIKSQLNNIANTHFSN